MRVRRLLVGFSEQSRTRLTFLSPRSSRPLARTPTLITPFRALDSDTEDRRQGQQHDNQRSDVTPLPSSLQTPTCL